MMVSSGSGLDESTLHAHNLAGAEMFRFILYQFQQLLADGCLIPLLLFIIRM